MTQILWPWKVEAEFADETFVIVSGNSEHECVEKMIDMEDKYGKLLRYSGVCDENYKDGEYIGGENFVSSESEGRV